jgi:hypothetical protein
MFSAIFDVLVYSVYSGNNATSDNVSVFNKPTSISDSWQRGRDSARYNTGAQILKSAYAGLFSLPFLLVKQK